MSWVRFKKIKVKELVGDKRFKLDALQLWPEQDRNCEKMLSILEDVSRKFDDQSKVLEVMKTQLQTVTDQMKALTVQNRQVPGTSSGTEEHFHQQRGDIEDTKTHTQKIAHQPKTPIIPNTPIFGSSSGAESSVPENTETNELHEHKESINPAQKDTEYDIIKNKLRTEIMDHYEVTGYSTTAVPVLVKGEDVHIDEMCLMPLMRVSNSVATAKQGHTSMQDSSDVTQLTAVENEDVMTGRISTIHELFQKDGQSIRRLCISGEAGEGKTTVCQKIVSTWCKVHGNNGNVSDTDYKFLKAFDLLFYIPLRNHKTADVIEMVKIGIVRETSHNALKEVLQKESEKCLIILDGLDEWLPPKDCKHKVPYIDPREQFTILITSRPWKLEVLRPKICEGTQNRVYLSESELYDMMIDDMNNDVCDDTCDDDIDINDYIYEDHDDYVEPEDDDAYDYMYD